MHALPYESSRIGNTTLVSLPDFHQALSEILIKHGTLFSWAETSPKSKAMQGRAVVYAAPLEHDDRVVVVRHSWHGGLLAPITRDIFLLPTRAPREAAVTMELAKNGVPVPQNIGYALYNAGPGLARVDVISQYIEESVDFGSILAETNSKLSLEYATDLVLELLHKLADTGAEHPDLNVKNILFAQESSLSSKHHWKAIVLDVDVVIFRANARAKVMASNIARLARSIRSWHKRNSIDLDQEWIAKLIERALFESH